MIGPRRKRTRRPWSPTLAATGWGESTFAELDWSKSRRAVLRWAVFGVVVGAIAALLAGAPAAWLVDSVASASKQRLLLADARGTVWSGSAVVVLTGGEGSRDASALPGRLSWTLHWRGLGFELRFEQACCLNGVVALQVRPGFGHTTYTLVPPAGWVAQWPTALLGGLGTPWNTMQLGGTVRLVSPGLKIDAVQGRAVIDGRVDFELVGVSSRLSTLDTLGSYRMSVVGDNANPGLSNLQLTTQQGALQITGDGTLGPAGVHFRGEARASALEESALSNLLNIIGRRTGARSVISIG
ncbi:MAG TPA: type II secretion system protein N [Burkholderiaceae bacterium]|jgi:general secretion pathway protein N